MGRAGWEKCWRTDVGRNRKTSARNSQNIHLTLKQTQSRIFLPTDASYVPLNRPRDTTSYVTHLVS